MNQSENQHAVRSRKILHRRHLLREIVIAAVIFLVILFLGLQLFHANQQKVQLRHQVASDRVELAREKSQHRKLKMNIKQLNDKGYLERLIRQRYYYSKPGETIYSLPGDVAKDVTHN